MNHGALDDEMGDEDGVVRSVVEEDAEEFVPRKEIHEDVLRMGGGEAADREDWGELATEQARQGAKIRRPFSGCLPLSFRRSSSLYSISTSNASRSRASLRRLT